MSERICLVLEALSIVVCLHRLYGQRFKFDIVTLCFLTLDMVMMQAIDYYKLPSILSMFIYPVIALYCGIEFGFKLREIIINNILYLVIVGGIQLLVAMCYGKIFNILFFSNMDLLIVNGAVFLIILIILPQFKINKLSVYLQDKERILIISLVFCVFLATSSVVSYKIFKEAELYQYMPLFVCISFIFVLAGQLNKFKIISKMTETELKTHQMYADSFRNLIEDIRLRQHEFDNQISTIYSQHFVHHTYEDLVNAQKEHCEIVMKENRYNKLLSVGNHVIIGFLYGKFIELDKLGIEVQYKIDIESFDVKVPVYKLVEILGNLIKNAAEEVLLDKILFVSVIEEEGLFEIEVRNKSKFIEYDEIDLFFKKGFSKKGSGRGLGLYNVKNICSEYALRISCKNKNIDGDNWLSFVVTNKRETIKIKNAKISMPIKNNYSSCK